MRLLAAFCLLLAPVTCAAQSMPDTAMAALRRLSRPGAEPVVASAAGSRSTSTHRVFALVFPREDAAQIVVLETSGARARVVAKSKEFGYAPNGNYTASLNRFEAGRPDRFLLELSFRASCARGTRAHRFALHNGEWMVVGLDQSMLTCIGEKIVQDWKSSENFLTGKAERTTYTNDKPGRTVRSAGRRKAFPLSQFPPNAPDYEELQ
jgi:hypothetical protein